MRRRNLGIFAAATAVVAAAAIAVEATRGTAHVPEAGALLFPGLAERINEATTISIRQQDKTLTIERSEDADSGWAVAESDGYPASFETVKSTLVTLSKMKTFEPKTRNPELYPRLEVEDLGAEAASTLLTVTDAEGRALAELLVGKRKFPRAGIGETRTYVRLPGAERSWLVDGDLQISTGADGWIVPDLLDIDRDRLRSVAFSQPDGGEVELRRDAPDTAFAIVDPIAEGRVPDGDQIRRRAGAIDDLELKAVVAEDRLSEELGAPDGRAVFRTFDGLVVHVRSVKKDEERWVAATAEVDPATHARWAAEQASAGADAEGDASDGTEGGDSESTKGDDDSPKTLADLQAEAEAINARVGGWAFALPSHKHDLFETDLAALTKAAEPAGDAQQPQQ